MEEQSKSSSETVETTVAANANDNSKTSNSNISTSSSSPAKEEAKEAATTTANYKCSRCSKRAARKGCTQTACLACCTDTACATHKEVREQAMWKEQVLSGTTPLQIKVKELKRNKHIPMGRFREVDFSYLGDTVVVWDIKQYFSRPSWREDAIRKSTKRRLRQMNDDLVASTSSGAAGADAAIGQLSTKKSRRQRFNETMETLLQKSVSQF